MANTGNKQTNNGRPKPMAPKAGVSRGRRRYDEGGKTK